MASFECFRLSVELEMANLGCLAAQKIPQALQET
jgi:hypothetical protein